MNDLGTYIIYDIKNFYVPTSFQYARQISFSCETPPLPSWMTVYDALELLALLRGVPKKHIKTELRNYIEALGKFCDDKTM